MSNWSTLLQSDDYLGVKKYLKEGADVNEKSEHGESVVSQALRLRCSDELLELLVASGADLFDADDEGVSVFDVAITYNNPMMVQKMIDEGIDVNETRRTSGFTPLMAAVCYNRKAIVEMLMSNGANTAIKDKLGLTGADYARKTHRKQMLGLLGEEEGA
ncbi:ankyrin repeat domain-containing protein [Sulfurimonas sp. HSL-1656]|jgi:ankyrin repeat protein|uniref:ankyrin repeat domain-containing protein n=1 Tax=Thiomicrolovo subterrani TaxID=3131934 RepID=UPI0019B8DDF9|nr:ankyrin repeat domain-containing protein [Campylobacterales bacterium]